MTLGAEFGRFRTLDADDRLRCVMAVARRLHRLPEDAFTFRGRIVRAIAEAR